MPGPAKNQSQVNLMTLSRYGLLVSLCDFIPVPLVDSGVVNLLRRRMIRGIARDRGVELSEADIATLGSASGGGCLSLFWVLLRWPFKKVFRTVFFVWFLKGLADAFSDVVHRGLMIHEAFDQGWLPGRPEAVREAMDLSLSKIDTRPVERALMGVYRDERSDLNLVIYETTKTLRNRSALDRTRDDLARELEIASPSGADRVSAALGASLEGLGTTPELIQWFCAEMKIQIDGSEPSLESEDEATPPDV